MRNTALCSGLLAGLVFASSAFAQACPTKGDATLGYIATNNSIFGSGSTGTMSLRGDPNTLFWIKCCMDRGETKIGAPGVGSATFCLDLTSGCFTLDAFLSPSGTLNIPIKIPLGFTERELLCCQWVGINQTSLELTTSNVVCLCANVIECDKVNQLAYQTCFAAPSSYPVTIESTFDDGKEGKATVSFDPSNPPTFPITNGMISIEGIAVVGNEICVTSRIDAGKDSNGNPQDLDSSTEVKVTVGSTLNSEDIHTSCSKPLAAGMVFGDFVITDLVDTAGCADPCEGGVNCLGYCTTLDTPKSFPATITSIVSETDGSEKSMVTFSYDPNNPPTFPINNGKIYVDSVEINGSTMKVCSRVDNGKNSKGELQKFPASNMLFDVSAGSSNESEIIHVSCSKPLGRGSVFGAFKITKLDSVDGDKCEGGVNLLGYRNTFDEPASYPVTITSKVAEDNGSNESAVSFSFDPNNRPTFPIASNDGKILVNNVKIVAGKIQVVSFAVNGTNASGDRQKFPSNNMRFTVGVGSGSTNEVIHVSCSQPLAKGQKIGNFEILALVSVK